MSGFRIKLDESLGRSHAQLIAELGYEVDRVTDQGLSGCSDEELWRRVTNEGRFFITLDLDFSDLRRFPPGSHPGILLIRPRSRSREAVDEVLSRVLAQQPLESLSGCFAVADPDRTRIRRRPSGSET